jgi:autophagy-related protein 9
MAIANFILMPFILIFTVIFFFLQHAQEFHEKKSYLGPRQWSPLALWQLREFNELPHFFSQRLAACEKDADSFISRFPARAQVLHCSFFV